jgi:hypothetical protein
MSEHGKHNKSVCDKLYASGDCHDWVVTTAFYSAIHYLESTIFPFEHNGMQIRSLEGAFNKDELKRSSKHATRGHIIGLKLSTQYAAYKFLQDNSQTARYVNYRIAKPVADAALLHLSGIIAACTPKDSTEAPKK